MADYSVFSTYILPEMPGCPEITLEAAAQWAVRQFCKETFIWMDWIDDFTMSGEDEYPLNVSSGAEIVQALKVTDGQTDYNPLDYTSPGVAEDYDNEGSLSGYVILPNNTIKFIPVPDSETHFYVHVALTPSMSSTTFPDWIFSKYEEGLLAGCKHKLFSMAKVTWQDSHRASFYWQVFQKSIARGRINYNRQFTMAGKRVKPRNFV